MSTVAIVGGGFSGIVTAIRYLNEAGPDDRLLIIDRALGPPGGLAYGLCDEHHLLNVPAGGMSAFDEAPNSFVDYGRTRGWDIHASTYASRQCYGEYLRYQLEVAVASSQGRYTFIAGEAVAVNPHSSGAKIIIEGQPPLFADHVVLALGNFPPASISSLAQMRRSERYVADPWNGRFALRPSGDATVLLIGSGLTAADLALSILGSAPNARVIMLSRRGRVPREHIVGARMTVSFQQMVDEMLKAQPSARAYVRTLRHHLASRPDHWREAFAALRPITCELWERIPLVERRRFLRHVKPLWDTHRHRVPPDMQLKLQGAFLSGKLSYLAGRLTEVTERESRLEVKVSPRGQERACVLECDLIVNCTGPSMRLWEIDSRLVQHLLARGFITPDELGLGLHVQGDGAVIESDGTTSTWLSYIGPMLKAMHWEATAVPELRRHAHRLARRLVHQTIGT